MNLGDIYGAFVNFFWAIVSLPLAIFYALADLIPLGTVVESERHGGEIAANVLKAHGVEFIFTLVSSMLAKPFQFTILGGVSFRWVGTFRRSWWNARKRECA